jgi:Coenzyme PQQ synthesis protein D (PqqD)
VSQNHFQQNPDVVVCELGGGAALLDLGSGVYFSLNAVGAFVWDILGAATSIDSASAAVCEQFEVPEPQAKRDLESLFQSLSEAKLIQACEAPRA